MATGLGSKFQTTTRVTAPDGRLWLFHDTIDAMTAKDALRFAPVNAACWAAAKFGGRAHVSIGETELFPR
jgi:hypothetical protein